MLNKKRGAHKSVRQEISNTIVDYWLVTLQARVSHSYRSVFGELSLLNMSPYNTA